MNYALTESNVALIYDRQLSQAIDSKIQAIIKEETGDDQLAVVTWGDQRSFASTTGFIQVNVTSQNIIVSSARIIESNEFSNRSLSNVAYGIAKYLKDEETVEAKVYAYNFVLTFEEEDYANQVQQIKAKYFNDSAFTDEEFKFAYPTFRTREDTLTKTLSYNSVDLTTDVDGQKRLLALGNYHYDDGKISDFETTREFHDQIKATYLDFANRMTFDD